MPLGIQWARDSEFNWTFDNMGGCPLQRPVAGLWNRASFPVINNTINIPPAWGGGDVYYVWGVWPTTALFAWSGFWELPETGEPNLFASFQNVLGNTVIQLNDNVPDGTELQVYYIYNTGERLVKYESLNSTPAVRRAWRSATDYTFDIAVDRIFDLMAAVYFAYQERGTDSSDILQFLWETYIKEAGSNPSPLIFDDFSRNYYDKGSLLLYANSNIGPNGIEALEIVSDAKNKGHGRVLRFKPKYYYNPWYAAWFGYGFNWNLTHPYFNTIDRLYFRIKGACNRTKIQRFVKTSGWGSSTLVLSDESFNANEIKYYVIEVNNGGDPGSAIATVKIYKSPSFTLEKEFQIACPGPESYVNLGHGLHAYWQGGYIAEGDTWYIIVGSNQISPQRLHIVLNDSLPTDPDPWGSSHTFVHGLPDAFEDYQDMEVDFNQFWRLDNIIDCRDRKRGFWGGWAQQVNEIGSPYEHLCYDVHAPELIMGELYYTKLRCTWNLNTSTTAAMGYYVGIPDDVDSSQYSNLNFKIKLYDSENRNFRVKVRDANNNYFYKDYLVAPGFWIQVEVNLDEFVYERLIPGNPPTDPVLTHPLNLVDIGLPNRLGWFMTGSVPAQGCFELVDLKFDEHLTFAGSNHLRVVEFKYHETPLKLGSGPDWYFDNFGFNLAVNDPYPYVPRLALSLNAYGRNAWRGPTLVHYSHPLAPYLVGEYEIKNTELALHADAQQEFFERYGGLKGPIMPVHTRNDIENIALCGEANFNRFCWWPDYPETGHALGQLWAFYRLAEYFFATGDGGAWGTLDHWLNWLSTYVVPDGSGWKFPIWFGDQYPGGFAYDEDSYDPGATASIVIGCLYVYMRNGDARALALAQKLLADLRLNRASGDFGGFLYKSDYHYAWLNALVAHAFGLAVVGRQTQSFKYPHTEADVTHFNNIMSNFWRMSGDCKPNLLNADQVPFHHVEPHDIWDYAPNYMFMKEMGSMEGVVLMMHVAIDWALHTGSWWWFNRLLKFILQLGEGVLQENQIYYLRSNFMSSENITHIAVTYGNYQKDNSQYVEAYNQNMVNLLGRIKDGVAMHYGNQVITEDPSTAVKICTRTLEYFSVPKERVQITADLSAARFELSDIIKVSAGFHGYQNDKFALVRRLYDPKNLRVVLDLMRDISYVSAVAVDVSGSAHDTYAIDHDDETDVYWASRAQAS